MLAPQFTQVLAVVAAVAEEYLPAPQSRQVAAAEAPDVEEYLPAPQLRQALTVEAPAVAEYLPASQFTQVLAVVAAVAEEYLPATQSAQAVPDEPGSEVSTPARMDAYVTQLYTMILMYRAVTDVLKKLEVLSVLEYAEGR